MHAPHYARVSLPSAHLFYLFDLFISFFFPSLHVALRFVSSFFGRLGGADLQLGKTSSRPGSETQVRR